VNAAVHGLSTAEIDARFNDIASFADIGDFLEQPVKTYSSGMYVRLAFSVAVATEPDILIVDEALSVGDLAFQNKCMARIRKLSERGVTILFVTHDLSTSQVICSRAVWLHEGRVERVGDPVQVCREYYVASLGNAPDAQVPSTVVPQQETGLAKFVRAEVVDSTVNGQASLVVGEELVIRFALTAAAALESTVFALSVYRSDGDWLIGQSSREARVIWPPSRAGDLVEGEIVLDALRLAPGEYRIALAAYSHDLAICYALTNLLPGFTVRADFPTWGKVIHPIQWRRLPTEA
jgi:energy-coupling factor transporter ATP-binding protein EcfA2